MRLIELMGHGVKQSTDKEIVGLTADSRLVRPGFLFAALPSSIPNGPLNGVDFVSDALSRGAAAILGPPGLANQLRNSLQTPSDVPETIIAVTGTSGKSSVVDFVRQIWSVLGRNGASLGTLGVVSEPLRRQLSHTTPDPVVLHEVLAELVDMGIDHLALEASSHGLEQRRLDGVKVNIAAFTNLSRDHLDYHADQEAYFQAKLHLFDTVMTPGGMSVLPYGSHLTERLTSVCKDCGHQIMTFGTGGNVNLQRREPLARGQRLVVSINDQQYIITLPLIGAFQAENVLCAIALIIGAGELPEAVLAAAEKLKSVNGRLQAIGGGVFVDYAHKPDALCAAVAALRPYTKGRLILLFGCGGDRDRGKRLQMGLIAEKFADRVIVTDDNPRSEDPAEIRADILRGCPNAVEIGDREKAIATAIGWLGSNDLLLIAGKGHETGQEIEGVVHSFDDAAVARAILQECAS